MSGKAARNQAISNGSRGLTVPSSVDGVHAPSLDGVEISKPRLETWNFRLLDANSYRAFCVAGPDCPFDIFSQVHKNDSLNFELIVRLALSSSSVPLQSLARIYKIGRNALGFELKAFLESLVETHNLEEIRTCDFSNVKFVSKDGVPLFDSFAELLQSYAIWDGLVAKALAGESAGNPPPRAIDFSSGLERPTAGCALRSIVQEIISPTQKAYDAAHSADYHLESLFQENPKSVDVIKDLLSQKHSVDPLNFSFAELRTLTVTTGKSSVDTFDYWLNEYGLELVKAGLIDRDEFIKDIEDQTYRAVEGVFRSKELGQSSREIPDRSVAIENLDQVALLIRQIEDVNRKADLQSLSAESRARVLVPLYERLDRSYGRAILEIIGSESYVPTYSYPNLKFCAPRIDFEHDSFLGLLWSAAEVKTRLVTLKSLSTPQSSGDNSRDKLFHPITPGNVLEFFDNEARNIGESFRVPLDKRERSLANYLAFDSAERISLLQGRCRSFDIQEISGSCPPYAEAEWNAQKFLEQIPPHRRDLYDGSQEIRVMGLDGVPSKLFRAHQVMFDVALYLGRCSKDPTIGPVEAEAQIFKGQFNETIKVYRSKSLSGTAVDKNGRLNNPLKTVRALCQELFGEYSSFNAQRLSQYNLMDPQGKRTYRGSDLLKEAGLLNQVEGSPVVPFRRVKQTEPDLVPFSNSLEPYEGQDGSKFLYLAQGHRQLPKTIMLVNTGKPFCLKPIGELSKEELDQNREALEHFIIEINDEIGEMDFIGIFPDSFEGEGFATPDGSKVFSSFTEILRELGAVRRQIAVLEGRTPPGEGTTPGKLLQEFRNKCLPLELQKPIDETPDYRIKELGELIETDFLLIEGASAAIGTPTKDEYILDVVERALVNFCRQAYGNLIEDFIFIPDSAINLSVSGRNQSIALSTLLESYATLLGRTGRLPDVNKYYSMVPSSLIRLEHYFRSKFAPEQANYTRFPTTKEQVSNKNGEIDERSSFFMAIVPHLENKVNKNGERIFSNYRILDRNGELLFVVNPTSEASPQSAVGLVSSQDPVTGKSTGEREHIVLKRALLNEIRSLEQALNFQGPRIGDDARMVDPENYLFRVYQYVLAFKEERPTKSSVQEKTAKFDRLIDLYIELMKRSCEAANLPYQELQTDSLRAHRIVDELGEVYYESFQDVVSALNRASYGVNLLASLRDRKSNLNLDPVSFTPGVAIFLTRLSDTNQELKSIGYGLAKNPATTLAKIRMGKPHSVDFVIPAMKGWERFGRGEIQVIPRLKKEDIVAALKEYYQAAERALGYCNIGPYAKGNLLGYPDGSSHFLSASDILVSYESELLRSNILKWSPPTCRSVGAEYHFRVNELGQAPVRLYTEDIALNELLSGLRQGRARELLTKLCQESFGDYNLENVNRVAESFISNKEETIWLCGRELVRASGLVASDFGESVENLEPHRDEPSRSQESAAIILDQNRELSVTSKVVDDLQVPEGTLFHALATLGVIRRTPKAFAKYHQRLIAAKGNRETPTNSEKRSSIKVFEEVLSLSRGKISFSKAAVSRLADLLNQICLRTHNGDVSAVIEEIEDYLRDGGQESRLSEELTSIIRNRVIPGLLDRYRKVESFTHPSSVRVELFTLQVEAVLDALYFGRPIKVMGTGSGKSETGAVYCETLIESNEATGTLWVTKVSSRAGAAERLIEKILIDKYSTSVAVLGPTETRMDGDSFREFLDSNRYVVVGGDTLGTLMTGHPENFKILVDWTRDKIRVLDEFHLLDRETTYRSRAVQQIESKFTISLSATPVQHDIERIATILHINLPEEYPDIKELTKSIRENPQLAEELLRAHSTIFQLEDMALYFEDPNVVSFKDQLAEGLPRMPRPRRFVHKVSLSKRQTEKYIDIATNWEVFASHHTKWAINKNNQAGRRIFPESITQSEAFKRIIGNPESIDAGPPLSIVEGIKELALPLLKEGKKVIIGAENKLLLHWIHADPELQMYMDGVPLLDGDITPENRYPEIRRFEEDPKVQCIVGQVEAIGSSENFRSADLLIVVQPPKTIAGGVQLEGRVTRAIVKGEERFARLGVDIAYVEPTLDPVAIDAVNEKRRREVLKKGSVYEIWVDRYIQRLELYRLVTSRQPSAKSIAFSSTQELLNAVRAKYSAITARRAQYELVSARSIERKSAQYRTESKGVWREEFLERNILKHLELLGKEPSELKVALLPGPEGLEIDIYLKLGVLPENIYCFEGSNDPAIVKATRSRAVSEGCRFFNNRIETVLPFLDVPFDLVSVDLDGFLTPKIVDLFIKLPVTERALVAVNSLQRRENRGASELLTLFANNRSNLQLGLLKLIATYGRNQNTRWEGVRALKDASNARHSARILAKILGSQFGLDIRELTELLGELYVGSMHIQGVDQHEYSGHKGSPFCSTFAALCAWDSDVREGDAACKIRSMMHDLYSAGFNRGKRIRVEEMNFNRSNDDLEIFLGGLSLGAISKTEILGLVNYFNVMVAKSHRLPELLSGAKI